MGWMLMSVFLTLLGTVGLLIGTLFLTYVTYVSYIRWKYHHLPGPKIDSFLTGHLPTVRKMYAKGKYSHYLFRKWAEEYGPLYKIFILHRCMIIPTSQVLVKEFLTKSKYTKAVATYKKLFTVCGTRFLGSGLVTNVDHEDWFKRRSVINPAFHKKYLRKLMGQFNVTADVWIKELENQAYSTEDAMFSMWDILSRVTLDAIGQVAFDVNLEATTDKNNPFPRAITKVLEGYSAQMKDPILQYRWSTKAFVRNVRDSAKFLRSKSRVIIEERIHKLENGEPVPEDILTFIIRTLGTSPALTMEDMIDDFVTLFIAGQETTANALSFMFIEVGKHPDVLQKIINEVDDVIGDKDEITYEDIMKLEYITQVLKETLRLYPPAPGTGRENPEEVTIDDFRIPANSVIVISFFIMHRLPQYYEDPDQFIPERWDPGNDRALYTYMPFSLGQRSCVGQQFALIEAKTLVCKFFQKYRFELDAHQSFEVQETTTLRPKDGCKMTVHPK